MQTRLAGFLLLLLSLSANADTVLIEGPEVNLTASDMEKAILSIPEPIRVNLVKVPKKLQELMDSTYLTKTVAHRAKQHGLAENPQTAAELWNSDLNILAAAEIDAFTEKSMGGSGDFELLAEERYLVDREDYRTEEILVASHILIKPANTGTEQEALTEAERIRAELVSGKLSFEEAAKQYSADKGSAIKGGALGSFGKGKMVKPFEDAAFSIEKEGDISEPVKTSFGYHLIRLDDRSPSRLRSFEEVKGDIIKKLRVARKQKIKEDYLLKILNDPASRLNGTAIQAFIDSQQSK